MGCKERGSGKTNLGFFFFSRLLSSSSSSRGGKRVGAEKEGRGRREGEERGGLQGMRVREDELGFFFSFFFFFLSGLQGVGGKGGVGEDELGFFFFN